MTIPDWWLILSAVFFLFNILLFIALIVVVIKILPIVQQTAKKVEDLTVKVEGVAHRVEEVATSVKTTVDDVGKKAHGILGSVEQIASTASHQFERFSPYIMGAMTGLKLLKAVTDLRRSQEKPNIKEAIQKALPGAQKKKLFGIF